MKKISQYIDVFPAVNIISGKKPFTFLFLKFLDDYMSEGKECNSPFDCLSEFSTYGLNSQTHLP
jgi:hypothetical protein